MKFGEFSEYLSKLEKISSRIEITKILAEIFKTLKGDESDIAVYLLLGGLAPRYKNIVFNIADKMMEKVIAQLFGWKVDEVNKIYKKMGDLGDVLFYVAQTNSSKLKAGDLTIKQVYEELLDIAKDGGEKSQERKIEKSAKLLKVLDPSSAKFTVRIMLGKLRLGFSDSTILDAISWMEKGDKSAKKELEETYFVLPDVGLILKNVQKKGIKKAVKEVAPVVGIPVLPVLAQRIKTPEEMVEKMGKVAVEPKLDGLRLSLHFSKKNNLIKAYTRNLNENSWMFPELSKVVGQIKAKDVILDCEAVGLSEDSKKMANFQITMTRRRKYNISEISKKTKVTFYVFDILFKDGINLMNRNFVERRGILKETIQTSNLIKVVDSIQTNNPDVISELFEKYSKAGYEGILVKKLDSMYVSGRTGWRWVKMKQPAKSSSKLLDTIDVVIMGYSVGKGKRSGFGVGKFLVGVRDGDNLMTVTKVGTGLSDEQFKRLNTNLIKLKVSTKPDSYLVDKIQFPDYWVDPGMVVEIAADEITKSPSHSAGLALRFPRLVGFREDKNENQITTLKELKELFKLQNR